MAVDKQVRNGSELEEHLNSMDWDAVIPLMTDATPETMKIIEKFLIENDARITEASMASFVAQGFTADKLLGPEDLEESCLVSLNRRPRIN